MIQARERIIRTNYVKQSYKIFSQLLTCFTFLPQFLLLLQNVHYVRGDSESNLFANQVQLVQTGFTYILWNFIGNTNLSELNVTQPCIENLNHVNHAIQTGYRWPFVMMDSSGQIPVEVTGMGYADLGNYDQCLNLAWTDQSGFPEIAQYCLVSLLPDQSKQFSSYFLKSKMINHQLEMLFKIGLCLPAKCSATDLQYILSKALEPYHWDLIKVDDCQVKTDFSEKLSASPKYQKISLTFLSILIMIILFATIMSPETLQSRKLGKLKHFSLQTSYRSLVEPNRRMPFLSKCSSFLHGYVLCIHISFCFIIAKAFTVYATSFWFIDKTSNIYYRGLINEWLAEFIFFYGGMARSMNLWKETSSNSSIFKTIQHVILKMAQLSIIIGILIMIQMIIPLISSGPFHSIIAKSRAEDCAELFHSNLLFYQNYVQSLNQGCVFHTWSIAAEFQLIIFLVILVHIYKRSPRIGSLINILLLIAGLLCVGGKHYRYDLAPHPVLRGFDSSEIVHWFSHIYFPSSTHCWIFTETMLLTYLIMRGSKIWIVKIFSQLSVKKIVTLISFIYSFPFIWQLSRYDSPIFNAVYSIVFRLLCGIFFASLAIPQANEFRVFFSHREDKQYFLINSEMDQTNCLNLEESRTERSEGAFQKTQNLPDKATKVILHNRLLHIVTTLLRSTYYIHLTMLTWYLSEQRWPVITLMGRITHNIGIIVVSLVGGFFFHLFVIGPVTSLFNSFKSRNYESDKFD